MRMVFGTIWMLALLTAAGQEPKPKQEKSAPLEIKPPGPVKPTTDIQPFDPENLPPFVKPGAAAFTKYQVTITVLHDATATKRNLPRGGCTITVTVNKLTITKSLKLTQFLPPEPGEGATEVEKQQFQTLKSHEDAHVQLCKDVFDLVSDKIIKDVFSKFPKTFTFDLPADKCTNEEIQKALDEQLSTKALELGKEAADRIEEQMKEANAKMDEATKDGTVGPKKGGKPGETEPSTPENQTEAGKEAFKEFKKEFEKPKK